MSLEQTKIYDATPPPYASIALAFPVNAGGVEAIGGATGRNSDRETTDDLLEAIAWRRDREAFKQLFTHFAPRLKAFGRRLGADGQVAEDLAQDVMLTVWRRAGQFDRRKAGASTWIFTIARNRRIDMIRREARPDFDPEDPELKVEGEQPADELLAGRRRDENLHRAVARLPDEQSQLMRLAYFEDKSHGAIAEELNLPLGTVKSRIRLAMRKLREMVKDDD